MEEVKNQVTSVYIYIYTQNPCCLRTSFITLPTKMNILNITGSCASHTGQPQKNSDTGLPT